MKKNKYQSYYVSSKGEVFNVNTGKKLKESFNKGYIKYILYGDGKRNTWPAHRLVASIYLPNPQNKPCVNHKDGDKTNNCVDNLEWVTYSENERHSYEVLGKVSSQQGEKAFNAKLNEEAVKFIRKHKRDKHTIQALAKKFNVSIWTIRDVSFYRNWKHVK